MLKLSNKKTACLFALAINFNVTSSAASPSTNTSLTLPFNVDTCVGNKEAHLSFILKLTVKSDAVPKSLLDRLATETYNNIHSSFDDDWEQFLAKMDADTATRLFKNTDAFNNIFQHTLTSKLKGHIKEAILSTIPVGTSVNMNFPWVQHAIVENNDCEFHQNL